MPTTTCVFLVAPPGWDPAFHPSPRRQRAVLLSGRATITATDGETITIAAGDILLLNDQGSRGHLTMVQGDQDARFLLVGLAD